MLNVAGPLRGRKGSGVMFCRTVAAGVEIRLCEEQDAERTFALVDRNRDYLRQWLPWVDRTHSAEDSRQFARLAAEKHATGDELHAAIWANGEIAGGIEHERNLAGCEIGDAEQILVTQRGDRDLFLDGVTGRVHATTPS